MRPVALFALVASFAGSLSASIAVQLSQTSFNPTLGQRVTYAITVDKPGALSVQIVDRDLYLTRTLASDVSVKAGTSRFSWDGTDESGRTVADESWSVRVVLRTPQATETYLPAASPASMHAVVPEYYDRRSGILRYTLPVASRVHLQAGVLDPRAKSQTTGAVMKTIVNRAPRPAGAVVEEWMGMDESNSVYVPSLPNFVFAIAAAPLAENSVISYGNRNRDFVADAVHRSGRPVVEPHAPSMHHDALTTLDDVSPRMSAQVKNAVWHSADKSWLTRARTVKFTLALDGTTAARFRMQPARLIVYVDRERVIDKVAADGPLTVTLPANKQPHIVAVNWASEYGPLAATAFRIEQTE